MSGVCGFDVGVSIRSPHRSEGRSKPPGRSRYGRGRVSIRSPHRSEGRCGNRAGFPEFYQVSIRSPHRSEGRFPAGLLPPASGHRMTFQSAPPTEVRGDTAESSFAGGQVLTQHMVSIRSPHRSEGRSAEAVLAGAGFWLVSIRSPHRSEGRSASRVYIVSTGVSIRSPHRSEGRSWMQDVDDRGRAFQSAPPTEVRGDPLSPPMLTQAESV